VPVLHFSNFGRIAAVSPKRAATFSSAAAIVALAIGTMGSTARAEPRYALPQYQVLGSPSGAPAQTGYVQPVFKAGYAYGWFGAQRHDPWVYHRNYYGTYWQWRK